MTSSTPSAVLNEHDDPHPATGGEGRRTGQQRLGGRSERVVRDVMRATAAELSRVGYAELRVEDVAAQAGVNKTTIYRRWPNKVDLVDAAVRAFKGVVEEPPDLGSMKADLMAMLRVAVAKASTCEGRTIHRMITFEIDNPDVATIAQSLRTDYHAPWIEVATRGIARGELPAGSDARLLIDMILGAVFSKLRMREVVDDDFLNAVVNVVLAGAKAGGAIRGARAQQSQ